MDEKQLRLWLTNWPKISESLTDLNQFDRLLKNNSVEAALNAEMTHYHGHEKNQPKSGSNSRNGYSTKTVATVDGVLELHTPRDRDGTFDP